MPYDVAAMIMIFVVFIVGAFYCLDALVRRTSRSQHPVLEIAASLGSHRCALEDNHSIGDSAVDRFRVRRWGAHCDALDKQRESREPRGESGYDLGPLPGGSELGSVALWAGRDRALACAYLRMATAGFQLGAPRNISLGRVALHRDSNLRENYVRYLIFRQVAARSVDGIRAARVRLSRTKPSHRRFACPTHAGAIFE